MSSVRYCQEPAIVFRLPVVRDNEEEYLPEKHNNFKTTQNQLYLLSQDQLENPSEVFAAFFQHRHLAEHRQVLWDILCAAITSDHAGLYTPRETGGWVMYFRILEEMIEAAWVVNNKNAVS